MENYIKQYIKLTEFSASLDSDTVSNEICEEKEADNKLPAKQDENRERKKAKKTKTKTNTFFFCQIQLFYPVLCNFMISLLLLQKNNRASISL